MGPFSERCLSSSPSMGGTLVAEATMGQSTRRGAPSGVSGWRPYRRHHATAGDDRRDAAADAHREGAAWVTASGESYDAVGGVRHRERVASTR